MQSTINSNQSTVSEIINNHVQGLIPKLPPTYFSKHLLIHFKEIKQMELFKILEMMPKGVLHHCHLQCNVDAQFYRRHIFDDPLVYMNDQGEFKISTKQQAQKQNWKSIKTILQQKGQNYIFHQTIFSKEDILKYSGQSSAWEVFDKKISNFFPLLWSEHIFKKYVTYVFMKYAKNGYGRAEFRALVTGLTLYDQNGKNIKMTSEKRYLEILDEAIEEVKKTYPNFEIGIIYNALKMFTKQMNVNIFKSALKQQWHRGIGVDFVNQEDPFGSLQQYDDIIEEIFKQNPEYRLPKVYHAGETNDHKNKNVQIAIKAGSKRIGHGFNILQNLNLIPLCKDICLQLNPLSNLVLNYVKDPRCGAAPILHHLQIPISISPDDPGIFGFEDSTLQFFLTLTCYNWDIQQIKKTIYNSIKYSLCSQEQKSSLKADFEERWDEWLEHIKKTLKQ